MVFLTTQQVFKQQEFEEGKIVEARSRIWTRQIDQTKPTWLNGELAVSQLEDEIDYLQYGQSTESEFYGFTLSESIPSAWINFPTAENPSAKFKYVSIEFNMSYDVLKWNRQTYSLLDWLGDLGGLLDILLHIGRILVLPISSFTLKQTLMSALFRFKHSKLLAKPSKNS